MTPAQQQAYVQNLMLKQNTLASQIIALGGRELGRVAKAHNALMVSIDSAQLNRLTALPNVAGVRPLGRYEMALGETVPYIGAGALVAPFTGNNVKVAVLDSGVDYTHRNLGGPGTLAAYTASYGTSESDPANTTRDGLFPTAKVYEGYDFVGEVWPNGPRAPDPDPIDLEGHGTHVADIIGGLSSDNLHKGVAPGARILAVKVCSAVSTSCSGVAMLLGVDFALDPNGDSDLSDSVDVMNLSLGSGYGQREDDLTEALRIASFFGVVVVAAAGNDADRPYIVGSPSIGPAVISVAQTQVPSAKGYPLVINAPAAIAGTYPNTEVLDFTGNGVTPGWFSTQIVFVGRGCPAGSVTGQPGEDPYLADPSGKVALIDRGACNVSLKVDRAASAGAAGVLIGLVAAGDAIGFSLGGGTTFVPSLVITQATSNLIKAQLAASQTVIGTLDPAVFVPLAGSMVGSSSRGPGYSYNGVKPDIGAPGGSLSAEVGTGNGETPFSGTSGAAPMVAGAAALLVESCPMCSPTDIKSRMMNTAETNILTNPKTVPGQLAPVTRIGSGEVRVNRAISTKTQAWDAGDPAAISMAFGTLRLNTAVNLTKKIVVRNLNGTVRTYSITPEFRYADDAASGAVTLTAPSSLTVPAGGTATFPVTLSVPNPAVLPNWTLNGGSSGGTGSLLQAHEYDGYVRISDATDTIRVPWHFLPHKAGGLQTAGTTLQLTGGSGTLGVSNTGVATGSTTVFSLLGTSPKLPGDTLPRPGDNFAVVDLRAAGMRFLANGGGAGVDVLQFGVTTWGERSHPNYPAEFDVFLDVNNDGTDDYVVYNGESGAPFSSGANVTNVLRLVSGATPVANFSTTADLSSANAILNVASSAITSGYSPGTPWGITVCAGDNYYTGLITDCLPRVVYTPNQPRFSSTPSSFSLVAGGSGGLSIVHTPAADALSPGQTGLLFLYTHNKTGRETDIVTVNP
ncbi:MAG: S8 family serine peptidase [Bryobacteraceae bacterium]